MKGLLVRIGFFVFLIKKSQTHAVKEALGRLTHHEPGTPERFHQIFSIATQDFA